MELLRKVAGIVVIAHGSRRPEANQDLFELTARMCQTCNPLTFPAFLELAEPSIITAGDNCVAAGAHQIVLAPYFLSAGQHVFGDLESARRELQSRHPSATFLLAEPLGPHPLLEQILRERIDNAREAVPGLMPNSSSQ